MGDFWVFGYGSLIWRPGFEFLEEKRALLYGKHRALCIHSWVHRGTQEQSGLVLGLDAGGSCHGLARRVASGKRDPVIAYLRERELVTNVYRERWVRVRLETGEQVEALTYVVDQTHRQYAKGLSIAETIERVRRAEGKSGRNIDYVQSTIASLAKLGIRDKNLERICRLL